MRFPVFVFLGLLFLVACQSSEDTSLQEAQQVHRQVMALETRLLEGYKAVARPDSLQQDWYAQFQVWQSHIVTVPGVPHEHKRGEHHHHHTPPQLTSGQLLELQKSLLEEGGKLETQWKAMLQ